MRFICAACGYEGRRRTLRPGSKSMEWVLWLVFFLPGPIYSLWRVLGARHYCPHCGCEKTMVRSWTPRGRALRWEAEMQLDEEIEAMEAQRASRGERPNEQS